MSESPVWMDDSTRGQCQRLEHECGGGQILADKTGSRAYEVRIYRIVSICLCNPFHLKEFKSRNANQWFGDSFSRHNLNSVDPISMIL